MKEGFLAKRENSKSGERPIKRESTNDSLHFNGLHESCFISFLRGFVGISWGSGLNIIDIGYQLDSKYLLETFSQYTKYNSDLGGY